MASKWIFYFVSAAVLGDLARAGTIGNPEANDCEGLPTGTTLRNFGDCSSYLYCKNGEEETKFCQIGYLYNPEVNGCDLWNNTPDWAKSRCGGEGIQERADEEEYVPTCDFSTTPFYIAHPTDCTLYFICYRGFVSREKCRSGEEWDCKAEKCVKIGGTPEECECRNPPVTPTPTEPTPTDPTPTDPTPTPTDPTLPPTDPTPTPTDPTPTPTDPTPTPTDPTTPPTDPTPTPTDPTSPPTDPTPTDPTSPPTDPTPPPTDPTPTDPTPTPPPPSEYFDICHGFAGTKTHYPGNCTVYIFCADLQPFLYPCPLNWVYVDTVNDCRPPSEVDEPSLKCSQGPPDTCTTINPPRSTLPDPFSCRRYYTCEDSEAEPTLTECEDGPLLFDPPTGKCVPSCELNGPKDGVDASRCYQGLPCRAEKGYFSY